MPGLCSCLCRRYSLQASLFASTSHLQVYSTLLSLLHPPSSLLRVFVPVPGYRNRPRQKYTLPAKPCGDCCMHCFCMCCALAQEYRELKNRGWVPKISELAISQLIHHLFVRKMGSPPCMGFPACPLGTYRSTGGSGNRGWVPKVGELLVGYRL